MKNSILIKNGHIYDPANDIDKVSDVLVENGSISKIGKDISKDSIKIINASDRYIVPGLIDMHVHLREPGQEHKETVKTGTQAAVKGGFTSVLCMPNTSPALDNENVLNTLNDIIKKDAQINVFYSGCITIGREGEQLVDINALKQAGCIALTDDGNPVLDSQLMYKALIRAAESGLMVISHSEDTVLSAGGQINEGEVAKELGLKPIPKAAEEVSILRDISLSRLSGKPIHIAHVSSAGSIEMIRRAKHEGVPVTCETAPHYFTLTQEYLRELDTNYKINPPLRSEEDVIAVKEGIKDGTIDAIATDHAPHTEFEKNKKFQDAPPGIVGLETAVSLCLQEFDLSVIIPKLTSNPAKILGLKKGTLTEGQDADITILDVNREITIDKSKFLSKSRNTPFDGWKLKGCSVATIVKGVLKYSEQNV